MKVGFIGCGNMGGALARAISSAEGVEILLADRDSEKASALAAEIGGVAATAESLCKECDFLFLGVKPNGIAALLSELDEALKLNTGVHLVSMAAGVTLATLDGLTTTPHPAIRIMPNTPVAVGEGMTVYAENALVTEEAEAEFLRIMKPTGALEKLDEELIDAACAVSGCGPAFAYMFIDALAQGGEAAGLSRESALLFAAEMVRGAAKMVLSSTDTPSTLKERVCSPGGSTIEGVRSLEADGFTDSVRRAVSASFQKTKLLGKK